MTTAPVATQALQKSQPQTQSASALVRPGAMALMASRMSVEPAKLLDTLKATVFKGATNEELLALVVIANTYDLNPILKELYAFPAKGGGIVPVVSVDGWNKMLTREKTFDGIEFDFVDREDGTPFSCTSTIYIKDRSRPVKVTEYFDECYRNTEPWNKMKHRMLRHKALIQGARVAFGFSGVHDEDEAIDVISSVTIARPQIGRVVDEPMPTQAQPTNIQQEAKPTPTATEPAKAEPAKTAQAELVPAEPTFDSNKDLEELGKMCAEIKCSEEQLLAWMKESKFITSNIVDISEMREAAPKRLNVFVANFEKRYKAMILEFLSKNGH